MAPQSDENACNCHKSGRSRLGDVQTRDDPCSILSIKSSAPRDGAPICTDAQYAPQLPAGQVDAEGRQVTIQVDHAVRGAPKKRTRATLAADYGSVGIRRISE